MHAKIWIIALVASLGLACAAGQPTLNRQANHTSDTAQAPQPSPMPQPAIAPNPNAPATGSGGLSGPEKL